MLSKINRGTQPRINAACKALLSYKSDGVENNTIDSVLILSRDLYKANPQINSYKKIPYQGPKPSFYRRATTDFDSEYLDPKGLGDNRILEIFDLDRDFGSKILPRTEHIQQFVGDEFPLLLNERLGILCGLSNFPLMFENGTAHDSTSNDVNGTDSPQNLFPGLGHQNEYTTEKLRSIGRAIFDLHLGLSTVFTNEKYLSLPSESLEQTICLFNNEREMIPLFMKRNFIYDCVLRYRGTMRGGVIHSTEEYDDTKMKIKEVTSIGSFYTMIGLLSVKFNRDEVLTKVVYGKIINGQTGLINLATESLTKLRA